MANSENTTKTATAQKAEAEGKKNDIIKFDIEIRGEKVELEAPSDVSTLPFDFFLYQEQQKFLSAFAVLFGEAQLALLRAHGANLEDFQNAIIAYQDASGLGED